MQAMKGTTRNKIYISNVCMYELMYVYVYSAQNKYKLCVCVCVYVYVCMGMCVCVRQFSGTTKPALSLE